MNPKHTKVGPLDGRLTRTYYGCTVFCDRCGIPLFTAEQALPSTLEFHGDTLSPEGEVDYTGEIRIITKVGTSPSTSLDVVGVSNTKENLRKALTQIMETLTVMNPSITEDHQ